MPVQLRKALGAFWRLWAVLVLVAFQALAGVASASPHALSAAEQGVDLPDPATGVRLPAAPAEYRVAERGWLQLAYPQELEHWVAPLVEEANSFRAFATAQLGQPVLEHAYVRLAPSVRAMRSLAPKGSPYPSYAAGVAYSAIDLVLLTEEPVTPNATHDLRGVLRHELAHLALYDAVNGQGVPLWFNEGLAVLLSKEDSFARLRSLWTATVSGNLLPLKSLGRRFPADPLKVPLAYAQSADVVRFLSRRQDAERFQLLVRRVRRGQEFGAAMYDAYGIDPSGLALTWQDDVERRYTLLPVLLSGSLLWAVAIALLVWAWFKKRSKQTRTLRRWAVEEAREETRLARLAWLATAPEWVHDRLLVASEPPRPDRLPGVEHQGDWHTLH